MDIEIVMMLQIAKTPGIHHSPKFKEDAWLRGHKIFFKDYALEPRDLALILCCCAVSGTGDPHPQSSVIFGQPLMTGFWQPKEQTKGGREEFLWSGKTSLGEQRLWAV